MSSVCINFFSLHPAALDKRHEKYQAWWDLNCECYDLPAVTSVGNVLHTTMKLFIKYPLEQWSNMLHSNKLYIFCTSLLKQLLQCKHDIPCVPELQLQTVCVCVCVHMCHKNGRCTDVRVTKGLIIRLTISKISSKGEYTTAMVYRLRLGQSFEASLLLEAYPDIWIIFTLQRFVLLFDKAVCVVLQQMSHLMLFLQ